MFTVQFSILIRGSQPVTTAYDLQILRSRRYRTLLSGSPPRPAWRPRWSPADGACCSTIRPDGLLGVRYQRRLEVSYGHATKGSVRDTTAERRRTQGRRVLGSCPRRRIRRTVQSLRRSQHHAASGTASHHLGKRQYAAYRHGYWNANTALPLWRCCSTTGR